MIEFYRTYFLVYVRIINKNLFSKKVNIKIKKYIMIKMCVIVVFFK